jgi:hypothetical protein
VVFIHLASTPVCSVPLSWWLGMGSVCTPHTALHVVIYHGECFVSFCLVLGVIGAGVPCRLSCLVISFPCHSDNTFPGRSEVSPEAVNV